MQRTQNSHPSPTHSQSTATITENSVAYIISYSSITYHHPCEKIEIKAKQPMEPYTLRPGKKKEKTACLAASDSMDMLLFQYLHSSIPQPHAIRLNNQTQPSQSQKHSLSHVSVEEPEVLHWGHHDVHFEHLNPQECPPPPLFSPAFVLTTLPPFLTKPAHI